MILSNVLKGRRVSKAYKKCTDSGKRENWDWGFEWTSGSYKGSVKDIGLYISEYSKLY
jgi:hypothetical protein